MQATIRRDAETAISLLRKHRSATLQDVLTTWPGDTPE
jgi:hypothetical protein